MAERKSFFHGCGTLLLVFGALVVAGITWSANYRPLPGPQRGRPAAPALHPGPWVPKVGSKWLDPREETTHEVVDVWRVEKDRGAAGRVIATWVRVKPRTTIGDEFNAIWLREQMQPVE